jgi:urease accessory protein
VPVQVLERRLRLKPDPTIETLLQSLGAKVVLIDAPFEPEGGAYDAAGGRSSSRPRSSPRSGITIIIMTTMAITTTDHDHGHDHPRPRHHKHDHKHD